MRALLRTLSLVIVVFAAAALSRPVAEATLRRVPDSWAWGPRAVWTDGTANPMFHPFSEAMDSGKVNTARASIEMDQDTGNCKIRPALRYSDDGISWDTSAAIVSTYRTTTGIDYGSTWIDLTSLATPKNFVQFGIHAANESGSAVNICNASLMIQARERD